MKKLKQKRKPVKIDSTSDAYLLNRYVAFVTERLFAGHKNPIKQVTRYEIQWKNIWIDIIGLINDLKKLFTFDFNAEPQWAFQRIYYSILAFWFIFQGRHLDAHLMAFFVGSVSYDSTGQTSHTGEPTTISWTITIGSNSDRVVLVNVSGLSSPDDPTFDSNAVRRFWWTGATKTCYYVAPGTGSKTCAAGGGNIKVGGAISLYNVDQQSPIGTVVEEDGSSSPNTMTLSTQEDGSMRVDVLGSNRDDSTNVTASIDTGTIRHDDVVPQNQFRIGLFGATDPKATAGSANHVWTTNGFSRWYISFEVKGVLAVPTIDMASISGGFTTSQSHTVVSGTDKLIVAVGNHQGTISNVQWNGNSLTKLVGAATAFNESVEFWQLNSPTPATGNITATFSGGDGRVLYGINIFDSDNSKTPDSNSATGSGSHPTVSVTTTNPNCLILDAGYSEGDYYDDGTGHGPEQTSLANIQSASYQNFCLSYGEKGSTGSRTVDWYLTSGQRWAHVIIAIPLLSGPTEKTETDSGSGSDSVGVLALIGVTDTGSGADALSVLALIAQTDTGSGVDTIALLAEIGITDSGSGLDVEEILALIAESDSGSGVDDLGLVIIIAETDSGSGSDAVNILAEIPISDTGLGAEILEILAIIDETDSGSGDDQIDAAPTIDIADNGSGSDIIDILATIAISESGSGDDAIAILAEIALTDTATGSDALEALALIALSDTGAGDDALDILAQIAVSDSGSAVDAIGILALIALSDSAQGTEALDLLNSILETDQGTALDQESILALIEETDTGSGDDAPSVANYIEVIDSGVGDEILSLLSIINTTDNAQGTDQILVAILQKVANIKTILRQGGRITALSQRVGNVILKQRR